MSKEKTPHPEEKEPSKPATKGMRPLEERDHVFEHRHWVNEACGDDLWDL